VYEYRDEQVGLLAGAIAVRLVNFLVAPLENRDFDLDLELARLAGRSEHSE
jgi:hypothetical protein